MTARLPRTLGDFWSHDEVRAHIDIINALDDRIDNVIGRKQLQLRVERATDHLAPRCNCRRKLTRVRELGRIVESCVCGHRSMTL